MDVVGIGYQGLTVEGLISRLQLRGVRTLVDVRLNAVSRKRGFSKKSLAAALEQAGIEYLHRPSLGNQRDNRTGYAETESDEAIAARNRYREELMGADAMASLREVAEIARAHRVAVFCFEEHEEHCHRQQVLEGLRELEAGSLLPV